jgi:hypothetical protein
MVPELELHWLSEIAEDLAPFAHPRSKFDRLVLPERLIEAGLTLIREAEGSQTMTALTQAAQVRNGLMVAILGFHPIRRKNFAALELNRSLANGGLFCPRPTPRRAVLTSVASTNYSFRTSIATFTSIDRSWCARAALASPCGFLRDTASGSAKNMLPDLSETQRCRLSVPESRRICFERRRHPAQHYTESVTLILEVQSCIMRILA